AVISGRLFALVSIWCALLALVQTLPGWRADLAARRRGPLVALLLATTAFVVVNAASGLAAIPWRSVSLSFALGLGLLAVLSVWTSFPQFMGQPALVGVACGARKRSASRVPLSPPNQLWLKRLEHLMTVERVYRQESLSIGLLAVQLKMPEYRLRALINEGLGHRNFNAFVNHYRIDEARAALEDPDQIDVPVLTIALDAGFASITPFNRAFKAETGLTPTEFRQMSRAGRRPARGETGIERPN